MANVRSIPPCKPTRFRPGWQGKEAAVCTACWRNQDAMSHDRRQPSSEATGVHEMSRSRHPTACCVSSGTAPPRLPHGRRPVKLRPRRTQLRAGDRDAVFDNRWAEDQSRNRLQFRVGGCPRLVVPKKASCFSQPGSSCTCPFSACLAEPLIGGMGARDLEGDAPSLRLDSLPAAPTRMDAQVMTIKDTCSTIFAAQRKEGVDGVETKHRHSRTRPVVVQY
jgi:hypothetical protein